MTQELFRIGLRVAEHPLDPYVIAEIGVNHEGDLDTSERLISEAADGRSARGEIPDIQGCVDRVRHSPAYWDTQKEPTRSQFDLFARYDSFGARITRLWPRIASVVASFFFPRRSILVPSTCSRLSSPPTRSRVRTSPTCP